MPDQTSPSRSWMTQPQTGRHRDGSERSANRAVGAAIVAGGLALSVSLYPLPGESPLLELFPPKQELSEFPKSVDFKFMNRKLQDFSTLEVRDLAKVVELLDHTLPGFPTDAFLDLVKTYGVRDVVKSLELLKSFEPLTRSVPGFSGGGGGGGGGSPGDPTDVLPAWVMLLEFLKQNLADFAGHGLAAVLTNVSQLLGVPHTRAGLLPEVQVSALAAAPVSAPTDAQVSARTAQVSARTAPVSAPIAPVSAPTDAPVSALSEAPFSAPRAAPVSAVPEAPVSIPDPPNVGLSEPDPPDPDAQSPAGGSDGGSSGGSDRGSSGGSDRGSSGGSDRGSSGGSDRGSSGGSDGASS
jgi:hypothetical protein